MALYLGIDFSGSAAAWRAKVSRPNVWIATVEDRRLVALEPVQDLPGRGDCFARLVELLAQGDFAAAAIDAPFSLPVRHLPSSGHAALLDAVAALPCEDRPFPTGAALLAWRGDRAAGEREADAGDRARLGRRHPLHPVERAARRRALRRRLPGAAGAHPPAGVAVGEGPGMLVEAFPAAQLRHWGLPHKAYNRPEERPARARIVSGLADRLAFGDAHAATMLDSADALDAVVAASPPSAAVEGSHVRRDHPIADGLIAVHDAAPPAPSTDAGERFTTLLAHPFADIERIVSHGHVTPADAPYRQARDEWVMLLSGGARLSLEDWASVRSGRRSPADPGRHHPPRHLDRARYRHGVAGGAPRPRKLLGGDRYKEREPWPPARSTRSARRSRRSAANSPISTTWCTSWAGANSASTTSRPGCRGRTNIS